MTIQQDYEEALAREADLRARLEQSEARVAEAADWMIRALSVLVRHAPGWVKAVWRDEITEPKAEQS